MYTREELSAQIEKYIHSLPLTAKPYELYEPIVYTMEGGGKRLRPTVLLMACNMYTDGVEAAFPVAAAVEMFHNFTLLHDDIIDNSVIRRGKPSVVSKWGSNAAILSGDAMVICAYRLLDKYAPEQIAAILPEFNKMALEVCEGQQYDINFETRNDVTLDEYKEMIRLKTAVIFASAAKIGGMISGAPEKDCATLYDFGYELGMAFQIQDDYLDTYGDEKVLGKTIGDDIEESKMTFLAINALNEAGEATRRALLATFRDQSLPLPNKIGRVKTIYDSLDIPEITRGIISKHLDRALELLGSLSVGEEKTAQLRLLVKGLADRNK